MKLQPTSLLTFHKSQWCLDLRFRDKANNYNLRGAELMFFLLVMNSGTGLAHTLNTEPLGKHEQARNHRVLKGPLYKINGISYAAYGSSCGHIGFFMEEFPEAVVPDLHPYEAQSTYMDDVDSLYLSQVFTSPPVYSSTSYYRRSQIYHWREFAYWLGESNSDVGLHVFERRPKEPAQPRIIQSRLF
jgi:hypothetical protein